MEDALYARFCLLFPLDDSLEERLLVEFLLLFPEENGIFNASIGVWLEDA